MSAARKRVLLSGYYGYGNAGDEAVCAAVLQTMRSEGGDPEMTVLSGNPVATERLHGARAVPRGKLTRALKSADALIQGGGSLLQDATSARSVFYYLWVLMAARMSRKPVFLFAQGIGPLRRPATRAAVRVVLNRVQQITVRDEASRDLLARIGVRAPTTVTADPVFALQPASPERASALWAEQGLPESGRTLGLALRAWPAAPELATTAARAAEALQERGMDVVFFPMHRPADEDFAEGVRHRMARPAPIVRGVERPDDLMAITARLDLLIGMRLHALIFGAAMGIPLIGLSYDPKVDALLDRLGGVPALNVSAVDPDALVSRFDAVWKDRQAHATRLRGASDGLRDAALKSARLAREFLAHPRLA